MVTEQIKNPRTSELLVTGSLKIHMDLNMDQLLNPWKDCRTPIYRHHQIRDKPICEDLEGQVQPRQDRKQECPYLCVWVSTPIIHWWVVWVHMIVKINQPFGPKATVLMWIWLTSSILVSHSKNKYNGRSPISTIFILDNK